MKKKKERERERERKKEREERNVRLYTNRFVFIIYIIQSILKRR